jgi:hypothetical protein
MIRQNTNNDVKALTKTKAMQYLGIGRTVFDDELKAGRIQFIARAKRLLFPTWALDQWLNNTTNHIDCTKEAKRGMRTYHSSAQTECVFSLDALVAQAKEEKQKALLLKKSPAYKRNQRSNLASI